MVVVEPTTIVVVADVGLPEAVELDVSESIKSIVTLETGKDSEVSVRMTPDPFTQRLEVPGAPYRNLTPAHFYQPILV